MWGGMYCCLVVPAWGPGPGPIGGAMNCCGFGFGRGGDGDLRGSICFAVISGEFSDMNCLPNALGEVGDSASRSSGRFGNQVALGLPDDGTLVSLGVDGLDKVPRFLYAVDIDFS